MIPRAGTALDTSTTIVLVTVLYNCAQHLPQFFECMGCQNDKAFRIVVIDNASEDTSLYDARRLAEMHGVPCDFIANRENLGIAEGNNQGIVTARDHGHSHIVLINNDITCGDDLIANIRSHAVVPGLRVWTCFAYERDTDIVWYGGGALQYWRARNVHFDQARALAICEPVNVSYAPTCLMYVHASVFDEIGMMDPAYFVYYDDTDFCRRLQDAHIPIVYDPTVKFRHIVGGSSGGKVSEFALKMCTRNRYIYIRKHYRGSVRIMVTAITILANLTHLMRPQRRRPVWRGLREAFPLLPHRRSNA